MIFVIFYMRLAVCVGEQIVIRTLRILDSFARLSRVHRFDSTRHTIKETTMKFTLLAALLAVAGLTACEKTTVNPAPTVVTPTVEVPVAVPGPTVAVPVPGPAGAPGAPGAPGEKGEDGKPGDTVIVVPEKTN
jgi:hypothetical protein